MSKRIRLFEILFIVYISWFFLPIVKAVAFGGSWNMVFFAFYAASMFFVFLGGKGDWEEQSKIIEKNVLVPIIAYMVVFAGMWYFGWKDANAHIRVSFTYWGTFLFYYLAGKYSIPRTRIAKFLILMYIATYITTLIGVSTDISAVRALSHAGSDEDIQTGFLMKNIASIYFIQTSVLLVPFALYLFYAENIKLRFKILAAVFIVVELYFLFSSSLTISIILYFFALVVSLAKYKKKGWEAFTYFGIMVFLILFLVVDWHQVFAWLAVNIENVYISERMESLAIMLSGQSDSGDVGLRMDLYLESVKTFLKHPFGIGPNYSYIMFDEGIGHHSQLLDDLARYGIFAIAFYYMFLKAYYKLLYQKFSIINFENVVFPIFSVYVMMIILNLAFRSSYESVFVLYILPTIPDVINDIIQKRKLKRKGLYD